MRVSRSHPKNKKKCRQRICTLQFVFAIEQQAIDLYKNKYQQLEFYHNSCFNIQNPSPPIEEYDEVNDPISYINPISLRRQLARFRDKFTNRNELEFYTDGLLDPSPMVEVQMGGA